MGVKCSDYLPELKLSCARTLLLNTQGSVGSIGRRCGFGFYTSFGRAFCRAYGMSPSVFRKGDGIRKKTE